MSCWFDYSYFREHSSFELTVLTGHSVGFCLLPGQRRSEACDRLRGQTAPAPNNTKFWVFQKRGLLTVKECYWRGSLEVLMWNLSLNPQEAQMRRKLWLVWTNSTQFLMQKTHNHFLQENVCEVKYFCLAFKYLKTAAYFNHHAMTHDTITIQYILP